MDIERLTREQKLRLAELLQEKESRKARRKFFEMYPDEGPLRRELYAKHLEFFEASCNFNETSLIASNRSGKSTAAAYATTCHLTGKYPPWWSGRKFMRPTSMWMAGEDAKTVRDTAQQILLGKPGEIGTGLVPGDDIVGKTPRPGIPDAVDSISVRHVSGGISRLVFKGYDQGREAFQGAKLDMIWMDEEPPLDIYMEALMRLMATVPGQENGLMACTFTPLKGLSGVVLLYLPGGKAPSTHMGARHVVMMAWDDVPHLSEKAKQDLYAAIPPHQRDARTKGIPQLGSGAIYPISEDEIVVQPFEFPVWYKRVYALDVGWNRTAGLWGAIDPESDVCYLYSEHYRGECEPIVHAEAIKSRGKWIPGVIDPAARGRAQHDGQQLLTQYQSYGLKLTIADNAVESGIYKVWSRFTSGRLKVFSNLQNFLSEFRIYRRDEKGKVVKENDHLLDCARYLCNSGLAIAAQQPSDNWGKLTNKPKHQFEYNPYQSEYKNFGQNQAGIGGNYSDYNSQYDNMRYRQ